jgi:hypothetical protein
MKKIMLALLATALLATTVSTAEAAGRWRYVRPAVVYRPAVRVAPVRVVPRYVGPVLPLYTARPYYVSPYRYNYFAPGAGVIVDRGYYRGGGVIVRTPGFGLNIGY